MPTVFAILLAGCSMSSAAAVNAAPIAALPNPLVMSDGTPVTTAEQWQQRRKEITDMILTIEYGHLPPPPEKIPAKEESIERIDEVGADLHRITLHLGPNHEVPLHVGLYVPAGGTGPYPVVLAVEPVWEEHLRPVAKTVVEAGYIFAGYQRHDLDRDDADRSDGLHPLYPQYDWASLAVWAWGVMRVVDYLEHVDTVDINRIALTGHSRAGKVALLAGALDPRIALTVPHGSGAGGAGSFLIVEDGVETLELITEPERFHYWFCPRLASFAGRETELPFDQHFLRALVAPRAVASIDGLEDEWANPKGTRAMRAAAQPVFDLLHAPENNLAYFRPGGHDTTPEDWTVLIALANHFFNQSPIPPFIEARLGDTN